MELGDIAVELATARVRRQAIANGETPSAAQEIAEAVVRDGEDTIRALGTPDAIIATILDTYRQSNEALRRNSPASVSEGKINLSIIKHIESHRSRFAGGKLFYQKLLNEYIIYRVEIEVPKLTGKNCKIMGLDRESIRFLIGNAAHLMGLKTP